MDILIADRQIKVRNLLSILLSKHHGWFITGIAKDSEDLRDKIDSHKPDVLLLDWSLIDGQSARLLQSLRSGNPDMRIIVMSDDPEVKGRALSMGVNYFINKLDSPERMIATLRYCERSLPHIRRQ